MSGDALVIKEEPGEVNNHRDTRAWVRRRRAHSIRAQSTVKTAVFQSTSGSEDTLHIRTLLALPFSSCAVYGNPGYMTDAVSLGDVPLVKSMEVVASMGTVAVTVAAVAAITLLLLAGIIYCCCKSLRGGDTSCADGSLFFERRERYPLLQNRSAKDHNGDAHTKTLGSSGMSRKWDFNKRRRLDSDNIPSNWDVTKMYGPSKYPPPPIPLPATNTSLMATSVTATAVAASAVANTTTTVATITAAATTVDSTSVAAVTPVDLFSFRPRPAPIIYDSCDSSYGTIKLPRDSYITQSTSTPSSPDAPFVYIPPLPDDIKKLTMSFPKKLHKADGRRPLSAPPVVTRQLEESPKKTLGNVASPVQRWFFLMKKSAAVNANVDSVDSERRKSSAADLGTNDVDLKPVSSPQTVASCGIEDMKARLDKLNRQMVNASKPQKRKYIYPDPNDLRNHITR
ncbi:uncharacterized protein [Procambarus clarkii]|uniref:uncharacterized protein n=1 Tax=Procambarus clarkii TaxID=6728 RepID=UPI003743DC48